ncbi:hypothetical protein SETIT_2G043200v2 [Setaria italica]|uniref:C2 domain-containing protein n=1 Tax=Setaria italica TaxID=4555 RepID=A0A368PVE3_SETIT|nr:hypothetical protein SETIT_2G043200v2 [Setaria italica]
MAATARKLIVEVVEARDLLPKDGTGTSSPYARADFDGQRRKTRTVARDLNPAWNEALEFDFPAAGVGAEGEPLEVAVLHDVRVGPSRRSNFLGRVRLDARQFVRKGEEALIYFPLQKKGFFNWVRGDIGLKVYYVDVPLAPPEPEPVPEPPAAPDATAAEAEAPPPAADDAAATASADEPPKAEEPVGASPAPPQPEPAEAAAGDGSTTEKPPEADADPAAATATPAPEDAPVMTEEAVAAPEEKPPEEQEPVLSPPPQPTPTPTPMPRQVSMPVRRPQPPPPPPEEPMERSKHDLVDKMPYLFVRVATKRVAGKKAAVHMHGGRLHVRVCLDGGYNVPDEPSYACSDFRPSARQLWPPPLGVVELGIVGCKGLLPMRAADGKGCTDAYAVAKYGPKWARTRTIADSFDPAWNEQYTWPVYDPCTVLTVGVFDDPPPTPPSDAAGKDAAASRPMGKVRIRLSTLERGRVYRGLYPLIMMLPTGAKRMGDVELAVRFATSASALDVLHAYARPALPAMHHLRPVPVAHREALRLAAARVSAAHLARSEPPLRREVAAWMLDAAEPRGFSMRKLRANWNRAAAALSWVAAAARWVEDTRSWRNPAATAMAHAVLVLLAWHPDLVVPTAALHAAAVGVWRYRRRPRAPAPHPCVRTSMAEAPDREELDEEFDAIPSARPPEVVRVRYDRARMVGARLQQMVGDVATQAERLQALVSWRDRRATGVFVALCVLVAMVLYVVPIKMVAVVAGFYYLRHPMFRDQMPTPAINFFRRLPSMSERII